VLVGSAAYTRGLEAGVRATVDALCA
jgi:hypothetical protein